MSGDEEPKRVSLDQRAQRVTCSQAPHRRSGGLVSQFISALYTSGGRRTSAEYSDQIEQIPEYRAAGRSPSSTKPSETSTADDQLRPVSRRSPSRAALSGLFPVEGVVVV